MGPIFEGNSAQRQVDIRRRLWFRPTKRAATREGGRPFDDDGRGAGYAAILIFSAATAARFWSGWAISPASFRTVSVFFEVSATSASNAART